MATVDSRAAGGVWNAETRPLIDEAWRCYEGGATRSAIAATWSAVTFDLIAKAIWLADSGVGQAVALRTRVQEARAHGLSTDGVRAMQQIEDEILDQALALELVDSVGKRELNRIREDRNLSVHPSLRTLGESYEPPPQIARAHLELAHSTVLDHPAVQGQRALTEFFAYVADPLYSTSKAHITATFYDNVRASTRGNIAKLAAKHALLELEAPETNVDAIALANRLAGVLEAFAERERGLVRVALGTAIGKFQPLDGSSQLRALARMGVQDYFWDNVSDPLAERLDEQLVQLCASGSPGPDVLGALSVVRDEKARRRLPRLEENFQNLSLPASIQVMARAPHPYLVPSLIQAVRDAPSWATGNEIGAKLILPYALYYDLGTLEQLLKHWAQNVDCREASQMPERARELFLATRRLGEERLRLWNLFVVELRYFTSSASGTHYDYRDVELALSQSGYDFQPAMQSDW